MKERLFQPSQRPVAMTCVLLALVMLTSSGCAQLRYWWANNRMVGPNYSQPAAPVAASFSHTDHSEIEPSSDFDPMWWQQFGDPDLNLLVDSVYRQNLTLKQAACRIAESRAARNIAAANLFPQSQAATGSYLHSQNSLNSGTAFPGTPLTIDDWSVGFDASWEVDVWGRIRRSIDASDAALSASIHDYDDLLVTLIAEVASLYIQIRAFDERIALAQKNVASQKGSLRLTEKRLEAGRTSRLDVAQAESNVAATSALIPQLELTRQQLLNSLSVLLALPPSEIPFLSDVDGKVPEIPNRVVIGIPADLVLQRPDIRSAERLMAAQFEQIGIAEADMYPTFAINGTFGYQAAKFSDILNTQSFNGSVAPGFNWKILNYGRLLNAIRVEEAVFNQIRYDFENKVLQAQQEVEDGIIAFIKSKEQLKFDLQNEQANLESVKLVNVQYKAGQEDFGRVFVVESSLVTAQDQVVATKANVALGLIQIYKALGGGWQIRLGGEAVDEVVQDSPVITP